jgi:hypothetical protein
MANQEQRKQDSFNVRVKAAETARDRNSPVKMHQHNGDEGLPNHLMSFTKGLPHNPDTGLLANKADFAAFVKGIDSGDPADFKLTPLGPGKVNGKLMWISKKASHNGTKARGWESSGAGHTFDLEGPDAQAVTMKPAPHLGSDELTAEIGEVYCQALLRDIPFSVFYDKGRCNRWDQKTAQKHIDALNKLKWFNDKKRDGEKLTLHNAFRGFTKGDKIGPYLSQFLLTGNTGLDSIKDPTKEFDASEGQINYGAITISQKVRQAREVNYMTTWEEYLDVQNGADFRGQEEYRGNSRRFITTPRDLSTYVHYDALYEAYLNACLLLLSAGAKFDKGVPFQGPDDYLQDMSPGDHQQGFAQYGGPHILSLVTEVATRALKAVRFQKFNTHKRLRPEALAARFEKLDQIIPVMGADANKLQSAYDALKNAGIFDMLRSENKGNLLLPMAFCEGSPMHPSYGAGHATVAGACVTILKAFFDHSQYLNISEDGDTFSVTNEPGKYAFIPNRSGRRLDTVETPPLTVEGELNKLAANISIGRDWAGVHYYSDYKESLLLGEEIAIGVLEEQSLTYNPKENFFLTLPKFNGEVVVIKNGQVEASASYRMAG